MTAEQRRSAVLTLIERHTAAKTVSKNVARQSLIDEGIYDAKGELTPRYGGNTGKAKTAA